MALHRESIGPQSKVPEVPKSYILLRDGQVQKIEGFFNWNNVDIGGSEYERAEGGIRVYHNDPEHGGGGSRTIPIEEIAVREIREAFLMDPVDPAALKKLLPRYEIREA